MALQPFFKKLQTDLGLDGLALFFVDDSNFSAPHQIMLRTIQGIKEDGPKYGYHLNPDKGTYLLGRCETAEDARQRKATLVKLGLNPDIIRVHPDNTPIPIHAAFLYGAKVLGSYIGSPEYD